MFDFPNQNLHTNGGVARPDFDDPEAFENYLLEFLSFLGFRPKETALCGLSIGASFLRSLHLGKKVEFKHLLLIGLHGPDLLNFHRQFTYAFRNLLEADGVERYASLIAFWFFSHSWMSANPVFYELFKARYKEMFADGESIRALLRANDRDFRRGVPEGTFRCPTAIINGDQDIISPPSLIKNYAEKSNANFYTVSGGHVFTAECPEFVGRFLGSILEGQTKPSFQISSDAQCGTRGEQR